MTYKEKAEEFVDSFFEVESIYNSKSHSNNGGK